MGLVREWGWGWGGVRAWAWGDGVGMIVFEALEDMSSAGTLISGMLGVGTVLLGGSAVVSMSCCSMETCPWPAVVAVTVTVTVFDGGSVGGSAAGGLWMLPDAPPGGVGGWVGGGSWAAGLLLGSGVGWGIGAGVRLIVLSSSSSSLAAGGTDAVCAGWAILGFSTGHRSWGLLRTER
jgi:hypothetical protein